ncbi:MAG: hypothetical protein ACOCY7_00065 [Halodesulfurarchaeum sp.]
MARDFQSDDEGKVVKTTDGNMIGRVDSVSGSTAHVRPEESLSQSIRRRLGWSEEGGSDETYELRHSDVETITDDEIHVRSEQ